MGLMPFDPSRQAGLARLQGFVPQAGRAYQSGRNFDLDAGGDGAVSGLSPWLRHRVLSEEEVLRAVLSDHDLPAVQAFVQEVFWRGYFKGWLEQHPSVWRAYEEGVLRAAPRGSATYTEATLGRTGIACFDHWCVQLRDTGYLHNHARMWFASIWIFTLRLPWELGAAFFLRHLIDGDPASNTLSWRWVAGLHTQGKHYLATADNIARFTKGRFNPVGELNEDAVALSEDRDHPLVPFEPRQHALPQSFLFVQTEENCHAPDMPASIATLGVISPKASPFARAALQAAVQPKGGAVYVGHKWSRAIIDAAQAVETKAIVMEHLPLGPAADGMARARAALKKAGFRVHVIARQYDRLVWPHATKGFFKLKKQIPHILTGLGLHDG